MEKKNYKFKNKKTSAMKFSKNLFVIKVHHNNHNNIENWRHLNLPQK